MVDCHDYRSVSLKEPWKNLDTLIHFKGNVFRARPSRLLYADWQISDQTGGSNLTPFEWSSFSGAWPQNVETAIAFNGFQGEFYLNVTHKNIHKNIKKIRPITDSIGPRHLVVASSRHHVELICQNHLKPPDTQKKEDSRQVSACNSSSRLKHA